MRGSMFIKLLCLFSISLLSMNVISNEDSNNTNLIERLDVAVDSEYGVRTESKLKKTVVDSPEELEARFGKSARLSKLRAQDWSENRMFHVEELYEIRAGIYNEVETLDNWLNEYDGELFHPPITFDYSESSDADFTTPVTALRSYWHSVYTCDAEMVFRHSDPSFLAYLEWWNPECFFGMPKKPVGKSETRITVLISGSCIVNGKKYVTLFYRRDSAMNPASNRVKFHATHFVYLNGKYFLSNLNGSQFGNIVKYMGLEGMLLVFKDYEYARGKLQGSTMPMSFYSLKKE